MAETTHPGEAPPACPSLRFAHRGAKKKNSFPTLFAAKAGVRVAQRSVGRVSRGRRSKTAIDTSQFYSIPLLCSL